MPSCGCLFLVLLINYSSSLNSHHEPSVPFLIPQMRQLKFLQLMELSFGLFSNFLLVFFVIYLRTQLFGLILLYALALFVQGFKKDSGSDDALRNGL